MYNMVNTDVICPNCGEGHMIREEPKVIKSNIETYAYLCPICGFVHMAKSDEDMEEWIKSLDTPIKEVDYHAKQDHGKAKLCLVPRRIIWDIAAIREYGNDKYPEGGPDNWKAVEAERFRNAAYRHFLAYLDDSKSVDKESGLPHLWHLACNIAFLCEMEDRYLSKDQEVVERLKKEFEPQACENCRHNGEKHACDKCTDMDKFQL